jgi:hypothetical protein
MLVSLFPTRSFRMQAMDTHPAVIIRFATADDHAAMARLAQLEGIRPVPESRTLIAEVESEVLAALPLGGGEPLADPFRPTAALVELLLVRATHLRGEHPGRRGRLLPRLATAFSRPAGPASAPATPGNGRMLIR